LDAPTGNFHGFLYLVGIQDAVHTGNSNTKIDDRTFVEASINVSGGTYGARADYQEPTDDWRITANLPGGVFLDFITGSVNHHFNFTVPIVDGAGLSLSGRNGVGAEADASWAESGSIGSVEIMTIGLAWGIATSLDSPLNPGDFNGDGMVDDSDFSLWQTNFGIPIGAGGPQGDANLDGAIDAADYVVWKKFSQTDSLGNKMAAGNAVPQPSSAILSLCYLSVFVCSRTIHKPVFGGRR
jgi:hypothetical protein